MSSSVRGSRNAGSEKPVSGLLPAAIVDDRSADLDDDDSAELRDEAASLLASIVSRSSPLSRSFVLASLRALRALHLDTGSGPAKSRAQRGKPQTMSAAGRCSGSGAVNTGSSNP